MLHRDLGDLSEKVSTAHQQNLGTPPGPGGPSDEGAHGDDLHPLEETINQLRTP